jgi:hypothetical protein
MRCSLAFRYMHKTSRRLFLLAITSISCSTTITVFQAVAARTPRESFVKALGC